MSTYCGDGETAEVNRRTFRRARKEHRCCACSETIRVGDVYRNWFVVFDGNAETNKYCLRCARMYDEISKRMDSYEEAPDIHLACGHDWEEIHGEPPPEDIARLAFMTPDEQQRELAVK